MTIREWAGQDNACFFFDQPWQFCCRRSNNKRYCKTASGDKERGDVVCHCSCWLRHGSSARWALHERPLLWGKTCNVARWGYFFLWRPYPKQGQKCVFLYVSLHMNFDSKVMYETQLDARFCEGSCSRWTLIHQTIEILLRARTS